MPSSRSTSSPPTSSRATAWCCRKARPSRRSSPRPRFPALFAPIRYKNFYLADGAISSNTPIRVAVAKGAKRLIILPTGHACATEAPPVGAVANALHALTLLISRQLVSELEGLGPDIHYFVVPPLCPLVGSPYDFSRTADHIERRHPDHRRMAGAERAGNRAKSPRKCGRIAMNVAPSRAYAAVRKGNFTSTAYVAGWSRLDPVSLLIPAAYIDMALVR